MIAASAALGALLALVFSLSSEKVYTAQTTLLSRDQGIYDRISETPVLRVDGNQSVGPATAAGLADLDEVYEKTAAALGDGDAQVIADLISVTADVEASLLTIEADGPSPEQAADLANEFAADFIDLRRADDRAVPREAGRQLLAEYRRAVEEGASPEDLAVLRKRSRELAVFETLQTGSVEQVEPALPPSSPSAPRTKLNTVAGGLAGLLIGIGAALMLDRARPRFRSRREAERQLGAPVLAEVASAGTDGEAALQALRTRLRFPASGTAPERLLVLGLTDGDERRAAEIAAGLVRVSSTAERDAILVETQMTEPGDSANEGLAGLLSGAGRLAEAIERDDAGGARIAAGTSSDAASLLSGERTGALLDELGERFTLIVLAARSPLAAPDAVPLLSLVDGILIVTGLDRAGPPDAVALREQLEAHGVEPLGLVLAGNSRRGA